MRFHNPLIHYPGWTLVACAVLASFWLADLHQFRVSAESRALLEADQRNASSYEKVQQILGPLDVIVVSVEMDDVFSKEGMSLIRRISDAFEAQPGVVDVKSFTHSVKPVRRGMTFQMVPFVSSDPDEEELNALRAFSLNHPLVRNLMVADDARHSLILVTYRREADTAPREGDLTRQVTETLAPFESEARDFKVIGLPLLEEELRSTLRGDIQKFLPAALILLLVILWVSFRSWRILLVVLIDQAAFILMLPGIAYSLGRDINMFSVILFPLLTGIHLTLLAHLMAAFQRHWQGGVEGRTAVAAALRDIFKSCAFAAVTTAVGMLSLLISEAPQVRDFGLLGAAGIAVLFLMTFGPGVALLSLFFGRSVAPPRAAETVAAREQKRAEAWASKVTIRAAWIVAAAIAIAGLSAWGVTLVRTDVRATEFLNKESPARQAVEELDAIYGGVNVVQIEFDTGRSGGLQSFAFLRYLERVHQFAESIPEVNSAYSYAQLLAMMNQIWEQEKPGSLKLPDNPLTLGIFNMAVRSRDYPFFSALSDESGQVAYLIIRTSNMSADRYLGAIHAILDFARAEKPPGVDVSAAQGIHTILEADRRIIRSQIETAGMTFAIIGLILMILWRSALLAGVALVANAIPVLLVLGLAGALDIPLNSITIMVAAIALGIAMDDSVHFITYWRDLRRDGHASILALREAYSAKRRPIWFTSVILIAIFSLFLFSSFPPVRHFGALTATAVAGALVSALILVPACLWMITAQERTVEAQAARSMN